MLTTINVMIAYNIGLFNMQYILCNVFKILIYPPAYIEIENIKLFCLVITYK